MANYNFYEFETPVIVSAQGSQWSLSARQIGIDCCLQAVNELSPAKMALVCNSLARKLLACCRSCTRDRNISILLTSLFACRSNEIIFFALGRYIQYGENLAEFAQLPPQEILPRPFFRGSPYLPSRWSTQIRGWSLLSRERILALRRASATGEELLRCR